LADPGARRDFIEQFKSFSTHAIFERGKPGGIAAWARKAGDEPLADRVESSTPWIFDAQVPPIWLAVTVPALLSALAAS
jgi:hypothetical protein